MIVALVVKLGRYCTDQLLSHTIQYLKMKTIHSQLLMYDIVHTIDTASLYLNWLTFSSQVTITSWCMML